MAVDYSIEDLEQLLNVNSLEEYALSVYELHNTFKAILDGCVKNGTICGQPRSEFFDDMMLAVAENQLAIQEYTGRSTEELNKCSNLPPLFNKTDDGKDSDDIFVKNLNQYTLVNTVLHDSYAKLTDTNEHAKSAYADLARKFQLLRSKLEPEPTEAKPTEAKPTEAKPTEDESAAEMPSSSGVPDSDYDVLAEVSDAMSVSLQRFLENYDTLYNGKKSVSDCVEQLRQFSDRGLQVNAAMIPLSEQLQSLTEVQTKHIKRLTEIDQSLKELMIDMEKDMEDVLIKQL